MIDELKATVLQCKKCDLWEHKKNYVFGSGSADADIMFIGEAPGGSEDREGIPFVGRAGKILDELLLSVNIPRDNVFICNVLKCRPPNNRNPHPHEISNCTPYLSRQIEIINPKVICCLGNFATNYIMKRYGLQNRIEGISKIHGKVFKVTTITGTIKIIPLYHPAVATYTPDMINTLKKDIQVLVNGKH